MNKIKKNQKYFFAASIILLAAFSRFIPHPPNFTPIMAMSIFGGALFADKKLAFLVPLIAMLITDLFLGFHSSMAFVYLAFAIGVFLGFLLHNDMKIKKLAVISITGSVIFYILTNFGFWLMGGLYPLSIDGLAQAYFFGLPFFSHTPLEMFGFSLLGDITYCFSIYGVIKLAERMSPKYSFYS